jgi:hypothetical protein
MKGFFSNMMAGIEDIVEKVKYVSWKWILAKKQNSPCLIYERRIDHLYCIGR